MRGFSPPARRLARVMQGMEKPELCSTRYVVTWSAVISIAVQNLQEEGCCVGQCGARVHGRRIGNRRRAACKGRGGVRGGSSRTAHDVLGRAMRSRSGHPRVRVPCKLSLCVSQSVSHPQQRAIAGGRSSSQESIVCVRTRGLSVTLWTSHRSRGSRGAISMAGAHRGCQNSVRTDWRQITSKSRSDATGPAVLGDHRPPPPNMNSRHKQK